MRTHCTTLSWTTIATLNLRKYQSPITIKAVLAGSTIHCRSQYILLPDSNARSFARAVLYGSTFHCKNHQKSLHCTSTLGYQQKLLKFAISQYCVLLHRVLPGNSAFYCLRHQNCKNKNSNFTASGTKLLRQCFFLPQAVNLLHFFNLKLSSAANGCISASSEGNVHK